MKNINWAILGTGVVANEMASALKNAGKKVYAVGNRTYSKAVLFAEKYGIEHIYENYHDMFHDDKVDIIYITTPHNTHINFLREALAAGKHVLCEKSITLNSAELREAVELAEKNKVILGEAMTIYHMPLYKKLANMYKTGEFGRVNLIQLNFGSFKEYNMENRFFNKNLAGGAMLDIGVYALSLARIFLASKPDKIISQVRYAPTGVDEKAGIVMTNAEGEMAVISLSLHSKQPKRAVISCEKCYIEIMEYPRACEAVIVDAQSGEKTVIREGDRQRALQYEMEDMEEAVKGDFQILRLSDTIDVMNMMSGMRDEWQLYYPEEKDKKIL
ncbi:Gfo/Idh/MocA family protein [Pectinatus haikarae]|uniref:Dehydrogenase n=1 Tax=Pectinatus haikarae TaxID=349096 RepID=A0ABT9Y5W0_9FIRM|nr:Gfo/Idh/MocA family oxidoreductase [Pectinatus haikarae]MDQ0202905.1 putative dehydrogenase [Pectinatus haikarae]